ncbi:hypothetical protein [Paraliomyxa miuraensis]|uniref:hypothetical protein n=1 Tax=Paraliomyxa miuraensis TaxID=376150 RepID=UPI002255ABF4|nr:hypothetical protein [Paraliomyxa miuraensis]MCX4241243.1 hypothetical protein [Paraliomyxa miuraensis]
MTTIPPRVALPLTLLLAGCPDASPGSAGDTPPRGQAGDQTAAKGATQPHGRPSLPQLGEAIVAALDANDARALTALIMPRAEYEEQFSEIETEPGVLDQGPSEGWAMHDRINRQAMVTMLRDHGGKGYAFVRMESSGSETRQDWVIHRRPRLIVADAAGKERLLPLVGVVLEHSESHTFSVLSFLP